MLKVTDDKVTKAYENLVEEMKALGIHSNQKNIAELVMFGFKKGFVEGYNEKKSLSEITKLEISGDFDKEKLIEEVRKSPLMFRPAISGRTLSESTEQMEADLFENKKRYENGKPNRESWVAANDCYLLSEFLRVVERSVTNKEIITRMHNRGLMHWNSKNATSFIRYAIRNHYPIVKVGKGQWKYQKQS